MTKPRLVTSRTRSIITRSGRSVRNTSSGEGSSDATDGSRSYEVEDRNQARRGSRASSVESEATGDSANVYDSATESVLGSLQQFRLDGAADVARGSRPAALPPASVGQEVPVHSGAGAQIPLSGSISMGNQSVAAASPPPDPPAIKRPRKPRHDVEAKKARGSFEPRRVSSTPGSSEEGDSDDDAELFAADMSPAMQLKYAALRRQLHRARKRGELQHVTMTQQLIAKLVESSMSSASTAAGSSSSGSVGRSSHVSEKLQMHNTFVPKEVLNKIMDVQDTSIGLPAVSPSSAHVRDEASDAAARSRTRDVSCRLPLHDSSPRS